MKDWAIPTICIGGIILIIGFAIFSSEAYNVECIMDIVEDYCEKNNLTYDASQIYSEGFNCIKNYDPRISKRGEYERFYFLDNELDNCIRKERYEFKGLFSSSINKANLGGEDGA